MGVDEARDHRPPRHVDPFRIRWERGGDEVQVADRDDPIADDAERRRPRPSRFRGDHRPAEQDQAR